MRNFNFYVLLVLIFSSCTIDKTDYEGEIDTTVPEYFDFKEAVSAINGPYKVSVEALNGTFYKGYNEIHLKITDIHTGKDVNGGTAAFLPVATDGEGKVRSCPYQFDPQYREQKGYYSGYVVFTSESREEAWRVHIRFTAEGQEYKLELPVSVQEQTNKNLSMVQFKGNDEKQYVMALIAPQKPRVSENNLVAGVYQYNESYDPEEASPAYSEAKGYIVQLDPRMPEPSMGNHSSPNNKDLVQREDGFYQGVVNYTMTGNWTLNLILLNPEGKIIKGTVVPPDFTPGVEGIKSELHIDVLF